LAVCRLAKLGGGYPPTPRQYPLPSSAKPSAKLRYPPRKGEGGWCCNVLPRNRRPKNDPARLSPGGTETLCYVAAR